MRSSSGLSLLKQAENVFGLSPPQSQYVLATAVSTPTSASLLFQTIVCPCHYSLHFLPDSTDLEKIVFCVSKGYVGKYSLIACLVSISNGRGSAILISHMWPLQHLLYANSPEHKNKTAYLPFAFCLPLLPWITNTLATSSSHDAKPPTRGYHPPINVQGSVQNLILLMPSYKK